MTMQEQNEFGRLDEEAFDSRIREALDEVKAPEALKQQTLQAIEAQRVAENPAGEVVRLKRRKRRWGSLLTVAASFFLAVVLCAGGYQWYQQPIAYIGVDVNPSVELSVNRFDSVVSAEALNEDGEAVLQQIDLVGMEYQDALALLMESDAMAAYVSDDSFVDVNVVSSDMALADSLLTQSSAVLDELPCQSACALSDDETRQAAKAAGMGMGKYKAACELMELDASVTLEECRTYSMRQMHDMIDAHHGSGFASSGFGQGAGAMHHGSEGGHHGNAW